jgi:hypothetical protein
MIDLSPEGRALLKGVRDDFDASSEDCDRIGRALATRLRLGAGTLVGTTLVGTTGTPSAAVAAANVGAKWTGAALLLAAIGVGGGFLYYRAPRDASVRSGGSVVTAPLPQPRAPDVRPGPAAGPFAELDVPKNQPDEPPSRQSPEPTVLAHTPESAPVRDREHVDIPAALARGVDGTVGAETRLLRRADSELRDGNAARALQLLDEHARTFPHGVLSEERSAERITTLCVLGRVDEARKEARRFLAAAPDSPLAKVVRSSCGVVNDEENGAGVQ